MPIGASDGQFHDNEFEYYRAELESSALPDYHPNDFNTPLDSTQEKSFQDWKSKHAPNDSGYDYDLRGAFLGGATPAENGHFPDTWKKPNHPTFSDQSQYAPFGNPGSWDGETYIPYRNKNLSPAHPEAPVDLRNMSFEELKSHILDPVGPFGNSQHDDSPTDGQRLRDIDSHKASAQHLKTLEADMEIKSKSYSDEDATSWGNNKPHEISDVNRGRPGSKSGPEFEGVGRGNTSTGSSGSKVEVPREYYDKITTEERLSRTGVSHPGYRWQVIDKQTGKVVRDDLSTASGASKSADRLDNQYGGYRYRREMVRTNDLTSSEEKILQERGLLDEWRSFGN